jgi:hypothetical protein
MGLVREILLEVKRSDPFSADDNDFQIGELPGHWDLKEVSYHLVLLVDEGFLARSTLHKGEWRCEDGTTGKDSGLRLTWKGHDLLEELTDEVSSIGYY